ncbi:hypothetical protein LY76DRAFT_675569 [Colletotrichum caudatum]|nr:hypothetical protein LY76DRAFT_675569 [Colletotrichum caudatum]
MEWLSRLIAGRKARRACPDRIPTDEVLPVFFFDDTPMLRNAILCWTMRFNDVLDPLKLRQSLEMLLRRDDGWRKLRGRIRLDATTGKRLEIHVPLSSDTHRPAVTYYSHVAFQMAIDEHPLASQLPQPTVSTSLQANHGIDLAAELGLGPAAPHTMNDFLTTDAPQLSLHVVSFQDATLVSLTWPHIATDGMGMGHLVHPWSLVLAGRHDEVPPMLAAALYQHRRCSDGVDRPDGGVRASRVVDAECGHHGTHRHEGRMPSVFPSRTDGGVYLLNAAPLLSCIVPAREMRSKTHGLGVTARAIRETLTTQTSEAQIHGLNRLERFSIAENGLPAFVGDTGSFLIITTNMTRARFIEKLDFAPAVVPEPLAAPGTMVYYQMQGLGDDSVSTRNNFFIFGKPAGDYWINGSLPPAIWSKIEDAFALLRNDCE